jgi:hypothetical protein
MHLHKYNVIYVFFTKDRLELKSQEDKEFSLLRVLQTDPASYPMGTGGSFTKGKIARP